jgi:lectin-like protein
VFTLARVSERVTLSLMRRAPPSTRKWGKVCPCVVALPLLLGCHTTLEPVRLERAACSSFEILGAQYALCETPLDHAAAEEDCEGRDAHLVALETAEENDALADVVFGLVTSSNIWLGGSRNDDLVWSWPDGGIFWRGGRDGMAEGEAFVRWQPDEPNNSSSTTGGPEACLALTAEGADWNDRSCDLALPYACELD